MSPKPTVPITKTHPTATGTKWPRMRFWLLTLLTFNLSLITIQSCGLDVEDPTPPSAPVWVEKSLPEEWPERGIDAHESGGIFLEWYSSPNRDIVAYNIYRAVWDDSLDSIGDYVLLTRFDTGSNMNTEYIDEQIGTSVKYFYKLKAEDASRNLSEYSASVTYMLIPAINPLNMFPNGLSTVLGSDRRLTWGYGYVIEMEDYCITVLNQNNELLYRDNFQPGNYVDGTEYWNIPVEVELTPGEVYQWRVDTGANYQDVRETAGSESAWAIFLNREE